MVYGPSEHVALEWLQMVLPCVAAKDLKLSPKKCHFLRRSVRFLGHAICEDGVQTDHDKERLEMMYRRLTCWSQVVKHDVLKTSGLS